MITHFARFFFYLSMALLLALVLRACALDLAAYSNCYLSCLEEGYKAMDTVGDVCYCDLSKPMRRAK